MSFVWDSLLKKSGAFVYLSRFNAIINHIMKSLYGFINAYYVRVFKKEIRTEIMLAVVKIRTVVKARAPWKHVQIHEEVKNVTISPDDQGDVLDANLTNNTSILISKDGNGERNVMMLAYKRKVEVNSILISFIFINNVRMTTALDKHPLLLLAWVEMTLKYTLTDLIKILKKKCRQ